MPPESWAVEKDGAAEDDLAGGDSSSSEDSGLAFGSVGTLGPGKRPSAVAPHVSEGMVEKANGAVGVVKGHAHAGAGAGGVGNGQAHAPKRRRAGHTNSKHQHRATAGPPMRIRIYRANNAFHLATIGPQVSVADLTPALNERLLQGMDVETHRLYLKERGRGGC